MKYSVFALPLVVSASVIESRSSNAAPVAGITKLQPEIRKGVAGVQRTLTKFGPYTIKASTVAAPAGGEAGHAHGGGGMGMGGDSTLSGQTYILSINKGFCNEAGPCTVYGGRVGVMYEDGTPATPETGVYIHHVLTTDVKKHAPSFITGCNSDKPATSISSMGMGTGFIGTGEDSGKRPVYYTREDGSSDSGYWVAKGDTFLADVQLVNYNKEAKKIFITYDLEFSPGEHGVNAKGMLISVDMCRGVRIKTSATGPSNTTSGTFKILESGKIIGARGHLHDGGVSVDLVINKKHVCSSAATYTPGIDGTQQGISSMGFCGTIPVTKGDNVEMVVQYDLLKHPLRKGASGAEATGVMGMWSLTFEPTK